MLNFKLLTPLKQFLWTLMTTFYGEQTSKMKVES